MRCLKSFSSYTRKSAALPREQITHQFYDGPDRMIWAQLARGHVVALLDKMSYDEDICLVVSNKQEIQWTRIRKNPLEHWYTGNS